MRVIRQGTPRADRLYKATCRECDCEFEFQASEARFHPDQRDGDFLSIPCPTCHIVVNVAVKR